VKKNINLTYLNGESLGSLRSEYLVIYDIEDSKKRSILFERLKDFGLTGIQKSVFWGELNRAERSSLTREIKEIIGKSNDKIILTPVNFFENKSVYFVGHTNQDFELKNYGTI
jgi:CRISPR-associated protein Cas2